MLKLKNKKILVTGGSGNIGRVLVKKLRKQGVKVISLSSKNDIRKKENLDFDGVDTVVHLAAKLNGEKDEIYDVNVEGTKNVIEEAKKARVKRLIYVSTIMVFVDTKGTIRDENYKKKKRDSNWYADSKIQALKLVEKEKKLSINVLYPSVVLANKSKKLLGSGKLMSLVGSRERRCNYVSLERVTDMIIKVLEKGKKGEDFILGGENIMMKDFWWLGKFLRVPNFALKMILGSSPTDMYFSSKKINSI